MLRRCVPIDCLSSVEESRRFAGSSRRALDLGVLDDFPLHLQDLVPDPGSRSRKPSVHCIPSPPGRESRRRRARKNAQSEQEHLEREVVLNFKSKLRCFEQV